MPKVSRKQCRINRAFSGQDLAKPGFISEHKPSLMGETELYCYHADGPYGFQMDIHDAHMIGTRAKVKEFVDDELIYSWSERWTLLSGIPGV